MSAESFGRGYDLKILMRVLFFGSEFSTSPIFFCNWLHSVDDFSTWNEIFCEWVSCEWFNAIASVFSATQTHSYTPICFTWKTLSFPCHGKVCCVTFFSLSLSLSPFLSSIFIIFFFTCSGFSRLYFSQLHILHSLCSHHTRFFVFFFASCCTFCACIARKHQRQQRHYFGHKIPSRNEESKSNTKSSLWFPNSTLTLQTRICQTMNGNVCICVCRYVNAVSARESLSLSFFAF